MCERGTTINCKDFESVLIESYRDFAHRAGVSTVTLRKFFRGHAPIRRTTFNRISKTLREDYRVEIEAEKHFYPGR
ncbi:MAG: helix-turn-helix transcriptional regulator [Pseudomonadota bacterium]